jgi:hypothetical protein
MFSGRRSARSVALAVAGGALDSKFTESDIGKTWLRNVGQFFCFSRAKIVNRPRMLSRATFIIRGFAA